MTSPDDTARPTPSATNATTSDRLDTPREGCGVRGERRHRDAELAGARRSRGIVQRNHPANWCSGQVLQAALTVHRALGPGLLETAYRACLAHELLGLGLTVRQEVPVPLRYGDVRLEQAFRLDLLVGELVVVEVKAITALKPVHTAQLLTYLRVADYPLGMLLNFHSPRLMDGYVRLVNKL